MSRRLLTLPILMLVALLTIAAATAQPGKTADAPDTTPMPRELTARLWEGEPGPAQDEEGAPRLLIVHPGRDGVETDGEQVRYSGRVSPASAKVTLNGQTLKVYPGGIFGGLADAPAPGEETTWSFRATAEGQSTTVKRTVKCSPKPTPLPAWPPQFAPGSVSPTGTWAMPAGETLPVTVNASAGATVEYRIGDAGTWTALQPDGEDRLRGGRYTAKLPMPAPLIGKAPVYQVVSFRVTGTRDGETKSREMQSALRVAGLPAAGEAGQLIGRVAVNRATFLKNPTGWDRWGNFVQETLFPVRGVLGERIATEFGRGERGFVDNEGYARLEVAWSTSTLALPALTEPRIEQTTTALGLRWPELRQPLALVWHPDLEARTLRVSLPGAASLAAFEHAWEAPGAVSEARATSGRASAAPELSFALRGPIWGYDQRVDPVRGLELIVRGRPRLPLATREKPLTGLRIMLDAGHGGDDSGALGGSGVAEADINLVQAAWVETYLHELGAEVCQTRRANTTLGLDERVQLALDYDPDLFVSLHHNSIPGGTDPLQEKGAIVFYFHGHAVPVGEAIAGRIAPLMEGEGATPRVKTHVARVARNVLACPSVLVETGFLSNPEEDGKLMKTEHVKKTARAVAQGIADYFRK